MKPRTLTCITAITVFAALAFPIRLAAQGQNQQPGSRQNRKNPLLTGRWRRSVKIPSRYTVIDLGTLGRTFYSQPSD